ncbi:dual specificity phosphatase 14 [Brachionus plicatilis]|uniref:protein-serine/threonine phosphatase n=1 Tax=Brachionus plicatilis TaxID=10195 RepID=A0A3M7S5S0_BRAPC|nr:dual specificity phosphatase 14 [Brachionus plicatilis]
MQKIAPLNQIAKILDNLYLSSFLAVNEQNIQKYGITCVISVCKETPKITIQNVESVKVNVLDLPSETLYDYFDTLADKIHQVIIGNRGTCLVHCAAGISRSASIILVYLMKYLKMSLKDAHALTKSKRPFIRPNVGFWKQLIAYEKKLFNKNSVKIVDSGIGDIPDIYENEVRSMIWGRNNPELAGTLVAQKKLEQPKPSIPEPQLAMKKNAKIDSSSAYTTTYRASFQNYPR